MGIFRAKTATLKLYTFFRNALQETYSHLADTLDKAEITDKDGDDFMHFLTKLKSPDEENQVDGHTIITKGNKSFPWFKGFSNKIDELLTLRVQLMSCLEGSCRSFSNDCRK